MLTFLGKRLQMVRYMWIGLVSTVILYPMVAAATPDGIPHCDHAMSVIFASGKSSIRLSNDILRGESACYKLRAQAGQTLHISMLKDAEENVEVNVYAPDYRIQPNPEGSPIVTGQNIGRVSHDSSYEAPENDFTTAPKSLLDIKLHRSGTYMVSAGIARGSSGHSIVELAIE